MEFKTKIMFRIITYKEVECIYNTDSNNNNKVYKELEDKIEQELDERGFYSHTLEIAKEIEV